MDKAFEYRIYPSASQRELLQKTFGCCRWVYNKVLSMRQEEYAAGGRTRGINSYITLIPRWKRSEAPWLSEVDSMALQQSLRDLDRAYKNFFRSPGKVGFPRFKSKRAGRKSYRTNSVTIVDGRHIKLPKLGLVKARVSRPVEGRVLSATVKQVPSGKYYVAVCCTDVPAPQVPQGPVKVMGIDVGIHDLMVRSDGVRVANPKGLARAERKLAREQRRLSRKRKGSANRAKQRRKVALVHEKVANRRKDAIHKATTSDERGAREPSHRRRGPGCQGDAGRPPPCEGGVRRVHGRGAASARVQVHLVRARLRQGRQVLPVEQDLRVLRCGVRWVDARDAGMEMPRMRLRPRPRPERRMQHRP